MQVQGGGRTRLLSYLLRITVSPATFFMLRFFILGVTHRMRGGPNMAEIGNCPIFVAENGNVVHISADSDTKIVNETEISFS